MGKLGENFYGATKRVSALHTKMFTKPEVALELDQFVFEQVENGYYVECNPSEACGDKHQLHFVGYNYVVSATSSSTKVRMTMDSSMQTESGLSLN